MHLNKAVAYMKAVIAKERCIPFNRFSGSIGRTAQTKEFKSPTSKGRWPEKSCRILLGMLKNAESNAEVKGLDVDALVIDHIQVGNTLTRKVLNSYRLMPPPSSADVPTVLTVASTPTWPPHATSRSSSPSVKSPSHAPPRTAPRRSLRRSSRSSA